MKKQARILLVEDNPADSQLITSALKKKSSLVQVFTIENGMEAIDYFFQRGKYQNAELPDLVLLDLNLPGKNGIEILRELKAHKRFCLIPVVVFTSSEAASDIQAAYKAQANSYFSKSPDLREFFNVIETIWEYWIQTAKLPDLLP